jgi:hypothetical protein
MEQCANPNGIDRYCQDGHRPLCIDDPSDQQREQRRCKTPWSKPAKKELCKPVCPGSNHRNPDRHRPNHKQAEENEAGNAPVDCHQCIGDHSEADEEEGRPDEELAVAFDELINELHCPFT